MRVSLSLAGVMTIVIVIVVVTEHDSCMCVTCCNSLPREEEDVDF